MLTLDRPDALHPITVDLPPAADAALDGFGTDRARALVLSGRGRAFCAGADLDLVRSAFDGDPPAALGELADSLHAVIRRLRRRPFPVVAAVEGAAVGVGMGLAGRALELTRTLTGLPPLALQRTRGLIHRATTQSLSAQLDAERRLIAELWATADLREGVGSFLGKRIPVYEGR